MQEISTPRQAPRRSGSGRFAGRHGSCARRGSHHGPWGTGTPPAAGGRVLAARLVPHAEQGAQGELLLPARWSWGCHTAGTASGSWGHSPALPCGGDCGNPPRQRFELCWEGMTQSEKKRMFRIQPNAFQSKLSCDSSSWIQRNSFHVLKCLLRAEAFIGE